MGGDRGYFEAHDAHAERGEGGEVTSAVGGK